MAPETACICVILLVTLSVVLLHSKVVKRRLAVWPGGKVVLFPLLHPFGFLNLAQDCFAWLYF